MSVLVSVISHRPFKKVKVQFDYLKILADEFGIDVQFQYQSKEYYNQVPKEYFESMSILLDASATCAGDNLYNSSKTFHKYDYILNMDDDLSRFSDVVLKEGKLGHTVNSSTGRDYYDVNRESADVLNRFIKDGIEKINSGNFAYVTMQGRLFCEYRDYVWKDTKSTSSTQFALWRSGLFKEAIDYFRQFEFPRVHGYDQFYRAYAMDKGYTYSCNIRMALYTKNQGVNDSVIRPDGTFADLSVLDTIFVKELYPGMFKYRKMRTGFVKLEPGHDDGIDGYLKEREINTLNNHDLDKFNDPYIKDISKIRSGEYVK